MPCSGSGSTGFCGHGQDDDRDAELGLVDLLDEVQALDPALEQRVDDARRPAGAPGSGRRPCAPSVRTSSSLTLACAFSSPRMYWATCGTSSTMSRRVWSLDAIRPTIPRGPSRRSHSEVPVSMAPRTPSGTGSAA